MSDTYVTRPLTQASTSSSNLTERRGNDTELPVPDQGLWAALGFAAGVFFTVVGAAVWLVKVLKEPSSTARPNRVHRSTTARL